MNLALQLGLLGVEILILLMRLVLVCDSLLKPGNALVCLRKLLSE